MLSRTGSFARGTFLQQQTDSRAAAEVLPLVLQHTLYDISFLPATAGLVSVPACVDDRQSWVPQNARVEGRVF